MVVRGSLEAKLYLERSLTALELYLRKRYIFRAVRNNKQLLKIAIDNKRLSGCQPSRQTKWLFMCQISPLFNLSPAYIDYHARAQVHGTHFPKDGIAPAFA
jgi:hypothetical protein